MAPAISAQPQPISWPSFSSPPTDLEIAASRPLAGPLVALPLEPRTADLRDQENRALAFAIELQRTAEDEDVSALTSFIERHPRSAWNVSLLTDLGLYYYQRGYFTQAVDAFERGWELGRGLQDVMGQAVVDRCVGELGLLYARLGRPEMLERLFAEIGDRDVRGSGTENLRAAREGLWKMQANPGEAYLCGPAALRRLLHATGSGKESDPRVAGMRSISRGTSLALLAEAAADLDEEVRMARWAGTAPVPVPAVVHWRAGHFAAITETHCDGAGKSRYRVVDPTFQDEFWITEDALRDQASGYFLLPGSGVPPGWTAASLLDAKNVWGKGWTTGRQHDCVGSNCETCGGDQSCPVPGMPTYTFHPLLASLHVGDVPLRYVPPVGQPIEFGLSYNYKDKYQGAFWDHGHIADKWTYNLLSYLVIPTIGFGNVTLYERGGGIEKYYIEPPVVYPPPPPVPTAPNYKSQAMLLQGVRYLPDGSREEFGEMEDSGALYRRYFLTRIIDPQGNATHIDWEDPGPVIPSGRRRIRAVRDALDRETTFTYFAAPDDLRIWKVTDPFGRFAELGYNVFDQLDSITDMAGMSTAFTYGSGSFVSGMTTPYGTTSFAYGFEQVGSEPDNIRDWVTATDPLNQTERVEYRHLAPGIADIDPEGAPEPNTCCQFFDNHHLSFRNSFYWNKASWEAVAANHATCEASPGTCEAYKKAHIYHWLHADSLSNGLTAGTLESEKPPDESRIWYIYYNPVCVTCSAVCTACTHVVGAMKLPRLVSRRASSTEVQARFFDYNPRGKITRVVDPVGRITVFAYHDSWYWYDKDIDLAAVQIPALPTVVSFPTYDRHQPTQQIDSAGELTTFLYNAAGQVTEIRNPLQQDTGAPDYLTNLTRFTYDGDGYLTDIDRPLGWHMDLIYDDHDRVATVQDEDGDPYELGYDDLDRLTSMLYPDGTTREWTYDCLGLSDVKDRLDRHTVMGYDPLRRLESLTDAMGRSLRFGWCSCDGLESMKDDISGYSTLWLRDLKGRLIQKKLEDGSSTDYEYEERLSRLKRIIDDEQQEQHFEWNRADELRFKTFVNPLTPTASIEFVPDTLVPRLQMMVDGSGTTFFQYHGYMEPAAASSSPSMGLPPMTSSSTTTIRSAGFSSGG